MKRIVSGFVGLTYVVMALAFMGPVGARPSARRSHHGSAAGRQVYMRNCARCHGSTGKGKNGPALAGKSLSRDAVEEKVTNGGSKMPAFGKQLSSSEIKAVAAYVQSLGGRS